MSSPAGLLHSGPLYGTFGSNYLASLIGQKKAKEIWYLCRQYDAKTAEKIGLVNKIVPVKQLEAEGIAWAKEILSKSPLAIRCLKSSFNANCDGQAGIQELAGNATLLYYQTNEGEEGHNAFINKKLPNFKNYPWLP